MAQGDSLIYVDAWLVTFAVYRHGDLNVCLVPVIRKGIQAVRGRRVSLTLQELLVDRLPVNAHNVFCTKSSVGKDLDQLFEGRLRLLGGTGPVPLPETERCPVGIGVK